jgi:HK97 family phage portal protein
MWFFNKKEEKRNAEQPHVEVEKNACDEALALAGLINKTYGKSYDPMKQSSFFAAVNLISNGIAQMGWEVKSKSDKNVSSVPYIDELFDKNNLTQFLFVKNIIKDVLLRGNGFAYIHRDQSGRPKSLEYMPFGDVTIEYNSLTRELYYLVPKIKQGIVEPINIIHLRINSEDGIHGRSIISYAANTITLGGNAEKSAQDFFGSGMLLQGILSTDLPIMNGKTIEQAHAQWKSSQLGDGTGVAILPAGMKYQNVTTNASDGQLLETRQFNITEIARWFNISPVLLGDYSKTAYNTIEQAQLQFVVNTLAPYVMMLEDELNQKIIMPSDKDRIYIDIIEEDIIAQDKQAQASYLTTLVDKGIITRNEARVKLGLNPVEGGDDLLIAYTDINQNKINQDKNTDENKDEEK